MQAEVVNLACSPRLAQAPATRARNRARAVFARGVVLVPPGLEIERDPAVGLLLRSTEAIPGAWVSPGGGRGALRCGLTAGGTYSASVELRLPARLAGGPGDDRLRIDIWAEHPSGVERLARSFRAPAERGVSRVRTTFQLPDDTSGAWLRVLGGLTAGNVVVADRLSITPTSRPVPYFDGDTAADRWYEYAWSGEQYGSESVRTMRPPAASFASGTAPAEVADELVRRLEGFLHAEAALLLDHLAALVPGSAVHAACRLLVAESKSLEQFVVEDPELRGDKATAVRERETDRLKALAADHSDASSEWVALQAARRLLGLRPSPEDSARVAALLEPVVRRPGSAVEASYLLGRALEATEGRRARDVVRAAAARDPAPFNTVASADAETERFLGRWQTGLFVSEHLDVIRERAADAEELVDGSLGEHPVFMYWADGFDHAPPLVQLCRAALMRFHDPSQVHLLDDRMVSYYSELPDRVVSGTAGSPAHYAGALRLDLLLRYGGYWIDATCLATAPLTESFPLSTDVTGIERFPGRFSSWFLGARPHSHLVRMLRSAIWLWWEHRQDLVDYYHLPSLFEMLYRLDERFRADWDAARAPHADAYHALQREMLVSGSGARLEALLGGAPLHKLAFRYDPTRVPLDSALARLFRERMTADAF